MQVLIDVQIAIGKGGVDCCCRRLRHRRDRLRMASWWGRGAKCRSDLRQRSDCCDEEQCSRLEVHHGAATVYLPYNAIAVIAGKVVRHTVAAAVVHEQGWYRK